MTATIRFLVVMFYYLHIQPGFGEYSYRGEENF
jgi:hypothetical protein